MGVKNTELIKMNNVDLTFYGMYILATLLGVIIILIGNSVYNKSDFYFLKSENAKFYGLFITGFVMCSLVMDSSVKTSGWNNIFVLLSSLVGFALLITLILFFFNIELVFLNNKANLIFLLITLIFIKVGIATIHRIVVLSI